MSGLDESRGGTGVRADRARARLRAGSAVRGATHRALQAPRRTPTRLVLAAAVTLSAIDVLLVASQPSSTLRLATFVGVTSSLCLLVGSMWSRRRAGAGACDPVTGLPDGTLLRDRLQQAVVRADHGAADFVLAVVNLDDFRNINERYGYDTGDDVLRSVAERLRRDTRKCDTVVRLGGDEFAVLAEGLDASSGARALADGLVARLQAPYTFDGRGIVCQASVGLVTTPTERRRADDLLGDAQLAMRDAKSKGKGTCVEYRASMHREKLEQLLVENGLYHALRNNELLLHYQPIVDLQTRQMVAVEALVRWEHPTVGLLRPDNFIPIAEGCGLIVPIGAWVVSESCRQLAEWNADRAGERPLSVNVNLSSRQLIDGALIEIVDRALHQNGLDPELLTLELTETLAVHDVTEAARVLSRLKALGVRIALDDFGTGSSSLGYLHRLPIDMIKLDKSLVEEVPASASARALTSALPALARALRLNVVVEGIERRDQLRYLESAGYELAQGYFFSPPVSACELEAMLVQELASRATRPLGMSRSRGARAARIAEWAPPELQRTAEGVT